MLVNDDVSGVPGGIRTPDLPLRRGPLYPSELPGQQAQPVQYSENQTQGLIWHVLSYPQGCQNVPTAFHQYR